MASELKGCPFCGSDAYMYHGSGRDYEKAGVKCEGDFPNRTCPIYPDTGLLPNEAEAVNAWHMRATRQPDAAVELLREVVQQASDTIVAHHQWHAAQTTPDPEHGFIPADEYADSGLYERTVDALGKIDNLLRVGPRDTAVTLGEQP